MAAPGAAGAIRCFPEARRSRLVKSHYRPIWLAVIVGFEPSVFCPLSHRGGFRMGAIRIEEFFLFLAPIPTFPREGKE
jgi:hypothetical protein